MRETEDSLRQAIDRHELELYYQPILNLGSSQVTCCEALIRWHHPTRGLVSPADFIPLAERTGQIADITAWVLREACRTAQTWPNDIRVAVNISPMLLKRADLLQSVMNALISSGLPAAQLELEITESVFMDDGEQSNTMLKALRRIGVRLALDDFGTGYSSLAYLHKYVFDKIKIDSSFVRNIEDNRTARAIVNAVVSLARTLEVETVAEGVETASQLDQRPRARLRGGAGVLPQHADPCAGTGRPARTGRRRARQARADAQARAQGLMRRATAGSARRRAGPSS